jgi:hypothetical protein
MVAGLSKSLNAFLAANFSDAGQEAVLRASRGAKAAATGQHSGASGAESFFSTSRGGYDKRPQYFRDYDQAPNDLRPTEELALFGLPADGAEELPTGLAPAAEEVLFVEGEDGVFRPSTASAVGEATSAANASASFTKTPPSPQALMAAAYQRNAALLTAAANSTFAFAA